MEQGELTGKGGSVVVDNTILTHRYMNRNLHERMTDSKG